MIILYRFSLKGTLLLLVWSLFGFGPEDALQINMLHAMYVISYKYCVVGIQVITWTSSNVTDITAINRFISTMSAANT
jgi:hypothetical protein